MASVREASRAAFSAAERRRILKDLADARREMAKAADAFNRAAPAEAPRLAAALDASRQRTLDLCQAYEAGLPVLPLSRCPFTGRVVRHSLDTFGIDGWWWDCERPVRPIEDLPATFFALSGALRLGADPPDVPFLCRPGPEVPFVVPRLLAEPDVRAVVSSVAVGPHRGFPVFYFAEPTPHEILRVNTWGLTQYVAEDPYGAGYVSRSYDVPVEFDYDLARWIRRGKLLWIAPDDGTLRLRSLVEGCPYLDLPGRRYPLGIRNGEVFSVLIATEGPGAAPKGGAGPR